MLLFFFKKEGGKRDGYGGLEFELFPSPSVGGGGGGGGLTKALCVRVFVYAALITLEGNPFITLLPPPPPPKHTHTGNITHPYTCTQNYNTRIFL